MSVPRDIESRSNVRYLQAHIPATEAEKTGFAFTNFSTQTYAALAVRDHADADGAFARTPLLAPGATHRMRFLDAVGTSCPDAIDLRLLLYRRIRQDLPIGLDEPVRISHASPESRWYAVQTNNNAMSRNNEKAMK